MSKRLLELRKALCLSQEEFGNTLGITGAGISKMESGSRNITDTMLKLICSTYDVSEQWLRTGEGEMIPPATTNERMMANMGTIISEGDAMKTQFVSIMLELSKDDRFWEIVKPIINKAMNEFIAPVKND